MVPNSRMAIHETNTACLPEPQKNLPSNVSWSKVRNRVAMNDRLHSRYIYTASRFTRDSLKKYTPCRTKTPNHPISVFISSFNHSARHIQSSTIHSFIHRSVDQSTTTMVQQIDPSVDRLTSRQSARAIRWSRPSHVSDLTSPDEADERFNEHHSPSTHPPTHPAFFRAPSSTRPLLATEKVRQKKHKEQIQNQQIQTKNLT